MKTGNYRRASLRGILISVALAGLLAGCGRKEKAASGAKPASTLRVSLGAEPESLDPHLGSGLVEFRVFSALFEGLIGEDPKTAGPVPGAAARWEISADGRVYTFHLQPAGRWSNGDPVTADDFVFSLRRVMSPALGNPYPGLLAHIKNARAYQKGETTDFSTVGVRVWSPLVLEIELEQPLPAFISMLNFNPFFPVHRASVEAAGPFDQRGTNWSRPPNLIGNGPFMLKAWAPGAPLETERNPHYWDAGTVGFDRIQFLTMDSLDAEERSFRAGQIDVMSGMPPTKLATYREKYPEQFHSDPQLANYFYIFNTRRPPFNDVRVRRAFALSLDRTTLVNRVTQGGETPSYGFFPPGIGGLIDATPLFREDVEEAKRLLAEAGFPEGKGFPAVTLLFNTSEQHRVFAEALQQRWRTTLGVTVSLENLDWKSLLAVRGTHDFQLVRGGWLGAFNDPLSFSETLATGDPNNVSGWSNPRYDEAVRAAASELDLARRAQLYVEANRIVVEDMPILPLYQPVRNYALNPRLRGWWPNLLDRHPWKHLSFAAER